MYSKYDRWEFLTELESFDEHLPVLLSSTDVKVFSGKMNKLIIKQLVWIKYFLTSMTMFFICFQNTVEMELWSCKNYFLIRDNDDYLKTQNLGLIKLINFMQLQQ